MRTVLHSYSLRDYPREHVFTVARAGGWAAVELAVCHLEADDIERDLGVAVEQAAAAGIALHCVGYWGEFAVAGPARQASIDGTHAVIDACAHHEVDLVNGSGGWLVRHPDRWDLDWRENGSALATDADYARVATAYRELADHAAARGVRIGVEIHPNTVHDTAAATARLLDLVDRPNVTVTLDPSNAAPLSRDDRDAAVLSILDGRASYFHLKNCVVRSGVADFTVDAASGVLDNYRWLEAVARAGFPAVCIEYCGEGDPHPRLTASRRYLDDTLALLAASGGVR